MNFWRKFSTSGKDQGSIPSSSNNNSNTKSNYVSKIDANSLNKEKFKNDKLVLLIIDGNKEHNWESFFSDILIYGRPIRVIQSSLEKISVSSYSQYGAEYSAECFGSIIPVGSQQVVYTRIDFVLVRATVKGVSPDQDFSNILYGLKFANVPSINTLESIYNFLERPWAFSELIKLQQKLGTDKFPLIPQNYYPNHREMLIGPQFPAVVKVGHAHAGYGKMKIQDHHDFADFASVIALTKHYVTAESFLDGAYDLRIQKIGSHYRVFKRTSLGNWKTNTGTSILEDVPLTDQYKFWVDEASLIFGGLDILAVDVIHTTDNKEFILEVNDSAIGLSPEYEKEDMGYIRDLVVEKMNQLFQVQEPINNPSSNNTEKQVSEEENESKKIKEEEEEEKK